MTEKYCDLCGREIHFESQIGKVENEVTLLGMIGSKLPKKRFVTKRIYCIDCISDRQIEMEHFSNSDEAMIISSFENWAESEVE